MGWAERLVAYFSAIGEAFTGLNRLTHIGGRWVPRSPQTAADATACVSTLKSATPYRSLDYVDASGATMSRA